VPGDGDSSPEKLGNQISRSLTGDEYGVIGMDTAQRFTTRLAGKSSNCPLSPATAAPTPISSRST